MRRDIRDLLTVAIPIISFRKPRRTDRPRLVDPPPRRVPKTLEIVSGHRQSANIGTSLLSPLVVRVLDQNGEALSGINVDFSVNPRSAFLAPGSSITDAKGLARTTLRFGNVAGVHTITASVAGLTPITFRATARKPSPPPPPARVATTLKKVSGDNLTGKTHELLTDAMVVQVLDQDGDPMSGIDVSFSVSPSGILGSRRVQTDVNGKAGTTLQFGTEAGVYTVTASVRRLSVSFRATAEKLIIPPPQPPVRPPVRPPVNPPPPPPPRTRVWIPSLHSHAWQIVYKTDIPMYAYTRNYEGDGNTITTWQYDPEGTPFKRVFQVEGGMTFNAFETVTSKGDTELNVWVRNHSCQPPQLIENDYVRGEVTLKRQLGAFYTGPHTCATM